VIKEEPVFVIDLGKERDRFGTMDGQYRTADEDILVSASTPMPMTDNRVIRKIYGTHSNGTVGPEHRSGTTKIGRTQVPNVVVKEKYTLPAKHLGQQQAEISFSAQVNVGINAVSRQIEAVQLGRIEVERRMGIASRQIDDNGSGEVSRSKQFVYLSGPRSVAADHHQMATERPSQRHGMIEVSRRPRSRDNDGVERALVSAASKPRAGMR
jgi:transposase